MNDFTKEELQYFLMTIKPFHFLWKHDPLELENKIQSMIDNYCEHEKDPNHPPQIGETSGPHVLSWLYKCKLCGEFYK